MLTLPIITHDTKIFEQINDLVAQEDNLPATPILLNNNMRAIEYLRYEMPELIFINFSDDKIAPYEILNTIVADPWLQNNIIALCDDASKHKQIEHIPNTNIIVISKNIVIIIPNKYFFNNP